MGLAILFFICLGAVMGVVFWQRRKRMKEDVSDAWENFKDDIGV